MEQTENGSIAVVATRKRKDHLYKLYWR